MSQLKQDEWPADNEPTTTEAQVPTSSASEQGLGPADEPNPGPRERESRNDVGPGELSNVTPDQQVD